MACSHWLTGVTWFLTLCRRWPVRTVRETRFLLQGVDTIPPLKHNSLNPKTQQDLHVFFKECWEIKMVLFANKYWDRIKEIMPMTGDVLPIKLLIQYNFLIDPFTTNTERLGGGFDHHYTLTSIPYVTSPFHACSILLGPICAFMVDCGTAGMNCSDSTP